MEAQGNGTVSSLTFSPVSGGTMASISQLGSTGLVALPGFSGGCVGSLTWFRCKRGSLPKLQAAWEALSLPMDRCPKNKSVAECLRGAMEDLYQGRGKASLVVAVAGRQAPTYGVLPRGKDPNTGLPLFETTFAVSAQRVSDGMGGHTLHLVFEGNYTMADEDAVRRAYEEHQYVLDTPQLRELLVSEVLRLDGIPMEGNCYIPPTGMEEWKRVKTAVQAASEGTRILEVPSLACDDAIEAILDALQQESEKAALELEADANSYMKQIDAVIAGSEKARKPRSDAVRVREEKARALEGKLRRYEELLGVQLSELRQRAEEVGEKIAMALLCCGGT